MTDEITTTAEVVEEPKEPTALELARQTLLDAYDHHNQNDNSDRTWLTALESLIDAKITEATAPKPAATKGK